MLRVCSVVLFGVVVLGGCVPLNMHGALREAYDRAEADHQAIKNELARALAESAGLQKEAVSLKAAIESLTKQARDLDAQLQQTSRGRAALAEQAVAARAVVPERAAPQWTLDAALADAVANGSGAIRREPGPRDGPGERHGMVIVELRESALYFNSASATIKSDGVALLQRIAEALQDGTQQEIREITVEAHTDVVIQTSRFPSGKDLAVARANGVLHYLQTQPAAGSARMSAAGYADSPKTLAREPAWARRVEIILRYQ